MAFFNNIYLLHYCMTAAALAHVLTCSISILATVYEDLHCFCVSTLLSARPDLQCRWENSFSYYNDESTSHNLAAYRLVWTPDASGHVRKSLEGNLVSVPDPKPIPVRIAFRGLGTRLESNLAWRSVLLECQGFKSY